MIVEEINYVKTLAFENAPSEINVISRVCGGERRWGRRVTEAVQKGYCLS